MPFPKIIGSIPFLSTEQMIEVDRLMIEEYRIELIQMMENAGRNLAHLARKRFFGGSPEKKHVVVLSGIGGNGGGSLVCARRLRNFGAKVQVYISKSAKHFAEISGHQLDILRRMEVDILSADLISEQKPPDLIIDGLLGYGVKSAPRGAVRQLIIWANQQSAPILALDIPSGINATTGFTSVPTLKATATMTLAMPKIGLQYPSAREYVGELYLADISVPPKLYSCKALQLQVGSIFTESEILRIW